MTAIKFYKFINENEIEFHWRENPETLENDVVFFLYYFQIDELKKLLTPYSFNDEGILCVMKYGYFAFWASRILDSLGIELTEVFGEPNND